MNKRCVRAILASLLLTCCTPALAAISYNLEQAHATPGETVRINAVVFNDTDSTMDWIPGVACACSRL